MSNKGRRKSPARDPLEASDARMCRLRPAVIVGITVAAIAMLAVPVNAASARLVWNVSPSAPAGLYGIEHDEWYVGDRVAVQPSTLLAEDLDRRGILPRGKLLIKRVAAGQGDTVCRHEASLTVNGALAAVARKASDSGEKLPDWLGCQELGSSDVLLLGDTANSYDGRYFGVTSAHDILGRARILVPF